jgi:hypothetical protein
MIAPEHSFPVIIGAVSAVSASALQTASATPSVMPLVVPLVSAIMGAIFSYGVLKTTVSAMEKDIAQMRQDLGQVFDLIRDASVHIARIEGRLDERE